MKKILAALAVLSLAGGAAFAGCGTKVENTGKLTSYDAEAKTIVVEGAKKPIKITPTTEGGDTVADLVGQSVKVVSEHGKADSVAEVSS